MLPFQQMLKCFLSIDPMSELLAQVCNSPTSGPLQMAVAEYYLTTLAGKGILSSSNLLGRFRAWAGSNHYQLVRPAKETTF